MTIGGIVSAVVLGAVVGVLGRLIVGRRDMPGWASAAVGVVAAGVWVFAALWPTRSDH